MFLHFLIFFHLNQTTSAFKIIDVNDLPKPNLQQNTENEYDFKDSPAEHNRFLDYSEIANENPKQSNEFNKLNLEDNGFKNKILVKRKVPHGIAPTGIEYDQKLDTVYKPLVRIHKTKSINDFLNENSPNEDSKHESVIFVLPNKHNHKRVKQNYDYNDDYWKKPKIIENTFDISGKSNFLILTRERIKNNKEQYQQSERSNHDFKNKDKRLQINKPIGFLDASERSKNHDTDDFKLKLLKEVQKKIIGIKSKSKRLAAYAKVLNVLKMLRSPAQFEKSGEAIEPLAAEQQLFDKDDKQKQAKKWIPHYPPWNYWTYKKTIHEDVCPGTQVKIGNMCIWTPPH